jgi:hypothetical protein
MTRKMNELPEGFEDLPIGFIQALFEFYRSMEDLNPAYNIGDISIRNVEPSMRAAIIRSDYVAFDKQDPIKPSEIYNFGIKLGLSKRKVMDIIAGKYDKDSNG